MKSRLLLCAGIALAFAATSRAEVVRPTPDIRWLDGSGTARQLSAFKGQPVVILFAPNPRNWAFRNQLARLARDYERLAAQKAVFVAAFASEPGRVPSNIPFAIAADGAGAAAAFGVERGFAIAVVGRDGNLDALSTRPLPGQRVLDIIMNSFVMQKALRRL